MLNIEQSIKTLESFGFINSTYSEHEKDCRKMNFLNTQFAPYDSNISQLQYWVGIRKFYIVKLSDGFQIRAWRYFE